MADRVSTYPRGKEEDIVWGWIGGTFVASSGAASGLDWLHGWSNLGARKKKGRDRSIYVEKSGGGIPLGKKDKNAAREKSKETSPPPLHPHVDSANSYNERGEM